MTEKKQETPTGHEIPVPTKEDVFRGLRKVAKADERSDVSAGSTEQEQGE